MAKGILYICTTAVTGLIKIGRTDNFNSRMAILEQNGYWNVSGLQRYFAVRVDDYIEKEKLIHTIFSKSQVANSELFALDKELAKSVLESFEGEQIYPVVEVHRQINDNAQVINPNKKYKSRTTFAMVNIPVGSILTTDLCDEKFVTVDLDQGVKCEDNQIRTLNETAHYIHQKYYPTRRSGFHGPEILLYKGTSIWNCRPDVNNVRPKRKNRSPSTFEMLGIPVGSELEYISNPSIKVKTINNRNKVQHIDGTIRSISAMVCYIEGKEFSVNGNEHFSYKGKSLWDIRNELEHRI